MLIRNLLSKIKPEASPVYLNWSNIQKFSLQAQVGQQNQQEVSSVQPTSQIGQGEEDAVNQTRTKKKVFDPAISALNEIDIESHEEQIVNKYLLFNSKHEITAKTIKKLNKTKNPIQKIALLKKMAQTHKKKLNNPLRMYEKQINLTFDKLIENRMGVDNNTRFVQLTKRGDLRHNIVNAVRLARIGGYQYIDTDIVETMFHQENISMLKQLYKAGYFGSIVLTKQFYDIIVNKTLNSPISNGFYVNLIYESFKSQVAAELQLGSLYDKIPIQQKMISQLTKKISRGELPQANPAKYYWSLINSNPKQLDKIALLMLKDLKNISVNGKTAEDLISSLSLFFIKQKAMVQIFKQILSFNTQLDQSIGIWAVTLIMFSRIKTILSVPEQSQKVNFNDLFNMMRQVNEMNFQYFKHFLPKILYHNCSPEIFMVYQRALKFYDEKNNSKSSLQEHYYSSTLQSIWNLNNKTKNGFQVLYNFPSDQLAIKFSIPGISSHKVYHGLDKASKKITEYIQMQRSSSGITNPIKKLIQDQAALENLPQQDHKEYINQHSQSGKQLLQTFMQFEQPVNDEQKFYESIDSSITRDILQGKYGNALDYVQLLLADKLDEHPQLRTHIKGLSVQSRRNGFIQNSYEQSLFILKQIVDKIIYHQIPNPKLTQQNLERAFDEQFDEDDEQFQAQLLSDLDNKPELKQKFNLFQIQHYCGQKSAQIIKKKGVNKVIEQAKLFQNDDDNDDENRNGPQLQQYSKPKQNERTSPGPKRQGKKYGKNRQQNTQQGNEDNEDTIDKLEDSLNQRIGKKKNWKDRTAAAYSQKKSGIFSKNNKKFSTIKDINEDKDSNSLQNQGYENYLKTLKQFEKDVDVVDFDFSKWKSFTQISEEFSKGIEKINQKNMPLILSKFGRVPIVGDISILIKYHFLKGNLKMKNRAEGLHINFETSLGAIEKDYGQYLQACPFMFKLPEKLYNSLLEDQQQKFVRKQFKRIIAHYTLFNKEISQNTARLICDICSAQKIGVTLLQVLQLFTTRDIKGSFQCVKIFAAGIQRYRNLSEDLLRFLKKYCSKFDYNIESRFFQPYIENMVQAEEYEKLNSLLQIMRQQLKPKDYKLNQKLSTQENLQAQKSFKIKQIERFRNESFAMIEIMANNLIQRTQIPLFTTELLDDYLSKKKSALNSKELGVGLIIYSQTEQKFLKFLLQVRNAGSQNNQYVFQCALKILKLFGRKLRPFIENILDSTLYRNKLPLNQIHLLALGQVFKNLDIANVYNEYLEYILRYQPPLNSDIKRLYYKILNTTTDDHAKNQMSGLLDMIFNENKEKDRIQFKKIKEQEEKKANLLKNITKTQNKNIENINSDKLDADTIIKKKSSKKGQNPAQQMIYSETLKVKKTAKKQQNKSATNKQIKQAQIEKSKQGFEDNKFQFTRNLTKRALRNGPLNIFLDTFMKRYEKTEAAEQESKKPGEKGKKKKDQKVAVKAKK